MIKLTCTSCHKPLSIDETKLPMKEVSFPCPSCKAKLSIDRRQHAAEVTEEEAAPVAAAPADEDDDDYGGERALIVGVDDPALRQAAKSIGLRTVFFPTIEAAREFYLQEYPKVVFLRPQQLTQPPLTDLAPIMTVNPADRRKGFYILVADNLRTFDGNAAFLYNVNLVLAAKDIGAFHKIYRDAYMFHQKLYLALSAENKGN
jgi:hypothetical protein